MSELTENSSNDSKMFSEQAFKANQELIAESVSLSVPTAKDYMLAVQQGLIPNQSVVWKFGFSNLNVTTGYNTVRMGESGLYVYAIGYGVDADTLVTSSTEAADVGVKIMLEGLDADGNTQTVESTVGSTTTETWSRVNRAYNSNGTPFIGDISVRDTGTGTLLSFVDADEQQSLQAFYTIPLGYTGYFFKGAITIGSSKEMEVNMVTRKLGKVFRSSEKVIAYESSIEAIRPFTKLEPLTDVEARIKPNTINTRTAVSFAILLIKD